ncbi:MAG TPA: GlsB/YeaQ/YmgE family stress response membrane protein [Actinomycetota bacterium]|nr:GlsB/YeaQ/YmgE family stress response membrane protein [Actinomycetota bacterium]
MDILVWLLIGLVAGAAARLLVPGRDPLGWGGTLVLGLIGSVIGGLIGNALTRGDQQFSPAGLLGSILGAIVALLIFRAVAGRRTRAFR